MADRDATTPPHAIVGGPAAPAGAPQWRKPQRHTYGAVDLGTNNCRLLIARPTDDGFTIIDAFSRVVRLGGGGLIYGARLCEPQRIHLSKRHCLF